LSLLAGLVALYIAYKYWQRQRLLRELRMARITVDELRQKLDAGEDVVILDLRSTAALEEDVALIPGAIHMRMEDLELRHLEIPRDRDVIVYCSCPNEASSARVALRLQRKGLTRVRPLLGGIDAWREQKYPMNLRSPVSRSTLATALAGAEDGSPEPAPRPLLIQRETQSNSARQGPTS
jgi:rhodanese-related sulfurtransferase